MAVDGKLGAEAVPGRQRILVLDHRRHRFAGVGLRFSASLARRAMVRHQRGAAWTARYSRRAYHRFFRGHVRKCGG